jgi:hypothetical protein
MVKKVSAILVSIIAVLMVIFAICSPNMSQMRMDCPDAQGVKISAFHEQPFSCFSLRLTGIQLFDQAIISPNILLIVSGILSAWFVIRISLEMPLGIGRTMPFVADIYLPLVSRKKHRWFAKHYSVY